MVKTIADVVESRVCQIINPFTPTHYYIYQSKLRNLLQNFTSLPVTNPLRAMVPGDIVDIYTNYTKLYKLLQPKLSNFDDSVNKFTMVYDNIIEQLTTNWDAVNVVFSGLIGTKLLISRGILYPLSPGASL